MEISRQTTLKGKLGKFLSKKHALTFYSIRSAVYRIFFGISLSEPILSYFPLPLSISTNYVYILYYTLENLTTRIPDLRMVFHQVREIISKLPSGKPRPRLKPHGALRKKVTCGSFNSLTTWKLVTTSGVVLGPKKNPVGNLPPERKAGHLGEGKF